MTVPVLYIEAAALLTVTAYGLVPLVTGRPLSCYLKRACTAWEALDRGTIRAFQPALRMWAACIRLEWRRLQEVER